MRMYGRNKISRLGQFEQLCFDNNPIPDDEDKEFVAAYYVFYDNDDDNDEEVDDDDDINVTSLDENDGKKYRSFFTTKRLLRLATKSSKIHADATYKVVYEGSPVLMNGTTDLDRHFHSFGISVCSNEKTADFIFIFKTLVETLEKIGEKISIDTLIADASLAIRNTFNAVFGEGLIIIMCWAHVRRNIVKHLYLVNETLKEEIMEDIDTLQLSSSEEVFEKAKDLFIKKYKKQTEFISYMKDMWFSSHRHWYEGAALSTPSHNNGLESHNLVVKKEGTFRERMPLSRFFHQCISSVEKWSQQYAKNDRKFIESPTINLEHWTNGYHWAKSNKDFN